MTPELAVEDLLSYFQHAGNPAASFRIDPSVIRLRRLQDMVEAGVIDSELVPTGKRAGQ